MAGRNGVKKVRVNIYLPSNHWWGEQGLEGEPENEEKAITRLRLGHTGLNRSLFIINKHETGRCDYCGRKLNNFACN